MEKWNYRGYSGVILGYYYDGFYIGAILGFRVLGF